MLAPSRFSGSLQTLQNTSHKSMLDHLIQRIRTRFSEELKDRLSQVPAGLDQDVGRLSTRLVLGSLPFRMHQQTLWFFRKCPQIGDGQSYGAYPFGCSAADTTAIYTQNCCQGFVLKCPPCTFEILIRLQVRKSFSIINLFRQI